ncbi:arylalkylamine N-acetyltransferase 1 [Halyomorpha halys]|uniref:arylalkylamine N-acetyltransferase 1 n=1 Tax=Halyomorpha halys TaxID=286706 RepID=UPI000D0C74E4|nr:uncharacterized protein LOC112210606 [Halyomorpha halys]
MDGWRIERVTKDDTQEIYDLLIRSYYLEEPVTKHYVEMYGIPSIDQSLEMQALPQGLSFKLVSEDGKILAVSFNMDYRLLKNYKPEPNSAMEKIQTFFNFIDKKAGNLERHADGWLCILAGVVDNATRNRGIADVVVTENEEECRRKGYKGIEVVCSSEYTSRLFAKRGYEHVFRYPYASYTDADGKQIFNPTPPHDAINVYIKRNEFYVPPTTEDSKSCRR